MNAEAHGSAQPAPARALHARPADEIMRFHKSERLLHWSIAIPFMICYATAVILIALYNPLGAVKGATTPTAQGR
jgi:hypothetical protein